MPRVPTRQGLGPLQPGPGVDTTQNVVSIAARGLDPVVGFLERREEAQAKSEFNSAVGTFTKGQNDIMLGLDDVEDPTTLGDVYAEGVAKLREETLGSIKNATAREEAATKFDRMAEAGRIKVFGEQNRREKDSRVAALGIALEAYEKTLATLSPDDPLYDEIVEQARNAIQLTDDLTVVQRQRLDEAFTSGITEEQLQIRLGEIGDAENPEEQKALAETFLEDIEDFDVDTERKNKLKKSARGMIESAKKWQKEQVTKSFEKAAITLKATVRNLSESVDAGIISEEELDAEIGQMLSQAEFLFDIGALTNSELTSILEATQAEKIKVFATQGAIQRTKDVINEKSPVNTFEDREALNIGFDEWFLPLGSGDFSGEEIDRVVDFVATTTIVPETLKSIIVDGMNSDSPERKLLASSFVGRIFALPNGSEILFNRTELDADVVEQALSIQKGLNDEIPADVVLQRQEKLRKKPKAEREISRQVWRDSEFTQRSLKKELNSVFAFDDPESIPAALLAQANRIGSECFVVSEQVDSCVATAVSKVKSEWGKSNIDGVDRWRVMDPVRFYDIKDPETGESIGTDWMSEYLVDFYTPKFPGFKEAMDEGRVIVEADQSTKRDRDADGNLRPTYQVIIMDPEQGPVNLTDREKGTFWFDYSQSAEKIRQDKRRAKEQVKRDKKREQTLKKAKTEQKADIRRFKTRKPASEDPLERSRQLLEEGVGAAARSVGPTIGRVIDFVSTGKSEEE